MSILCFGKGFIQGVGFLTRIPLPPAWLLTETKDFRYTLLWFSWIGIILASILWGLFFLLWIWFPSPLWSWTILISWVGITGGLHLDGLADTCDALFSYRSREKKLEIMKDVHIGTMGTLGIWMVLSGKWICLDALLTHQGTIFTLKITGIAITAGRMIMVGLIWILPYARTEGLGSYFWQRSFSLFLFNFLVYTGWIFILFPFNWFGLTTLTIVPCVILFLLQRWFQNQLGGGTGDTLGASCEFTELLVLLTALLTN